MLKKILQFGLIALIVGGGIGYYMWNKPHESIGIPTVTTTAKELANEFGADENAAAKKYVGTEIVVQVSGKITSVKSDTSGITLGLDTGDPMNGVSCVLDKFTQQKRTEFKEGEEVKLKGLCLGKNMDVNIDRCVLIE
jgi:hypothetical protein